jgi:hypothetical protein
MGRWIELGVFLAACEPAAPQSFGSSCNGGTPDGTIAPNGSLGDATWSDCNLQGADEGAAFTAVHGPGTGVPGAGLHFDLTWSGADDIAGRYAYVAVDGEDGYYADLVTLGPQPLGLDLVLSADAGAGEHTLLAALDDGTGDAGSPEPGPFFSWPVAIAGFGATDVLVSLSWATDADVDLHVLDPAGDEVSWETPVVASGGEIDNDGASDCGGDDIRTEDVYWPEDTAPSGTYSVFVDYYDACGAELTDYQVTVSVDGGDTASFAGSFGPDDVDAPDRTITEFSYP